MVPNTNGVEDVLVEGVTPFNPSSVSSGFDEADDDNDRQPLSPINGRRDNQKEKPGHNSEKNKEKGIMNGWSLVDARQVTMASSEEFHEPQLPTLLGRESLGRKSLGIFQPDVVADLDGPNGNSIAPEAENQRLRISTTVSEKNDASDEWAQASDEGIKGPNTAARSTNPGSAGSSSPRSAEAFEIVSHPSNQPASNPSESVQDLEAKVLSLKDENKRLCNALRKANGVVQRERWNSANLKLSLEKANSLKNDNNALADKLHKAEGALLAAEAVGRSKQSQIHALKKQVNTLRKYRKGSLTKTIAVDKLKEEANATLERLQEEYLTRHASYEKKIASIIVDQKRERTNAEQVLQDTIRSWEEKCLMLQKELDSSNASYEKRQKHTQNEINSLRIACEAEKRSRNEVSRKLMQALSNKSSSSDFIAEIKDLKQSIDDYKSNFLEAEEQRKELEGKLAGVQRSSALEVSLAKNKSDSLQRQLKETVKERDEAQASLRITEDDIEKLETRCGYLSNCLDALKRRKSESDGVMKHLKHESADMWSQTEKPYPSLKTEKTRNKELMKNMKNLKSDLQKREEQIVWIHGEQKKLYQQLANERHTISMLKTNLGPGGFESSFQLTSARRNSYSGTGLRNDVAYLVGYTAQSLYSAGRRSSNSVGSGSNSGALFAHKLSTELKRQEKEAEMAKTEVERLKIVMADMQKEIKKLRSQSRLEKSNHERKLSQVHESLGRELEAQNEARKTTDELEEEVEEVTVRLAGAHAKIAQLSKRRQSHSS